jgi:branched-subunit amino acid transport protein
MTAIVVFAAIGIGTYLFRASMLLVLGERALPAWFDNALALVGPAAIAALVASAAFTSDGRVEALPLGELVAIAAGFFVVRRTGNVLHALLVGFPTLWLLTLIGV